MTNRQYLNEDIRVKKLIRVLKFIVVYHACGINKVLTFRL